MHRFVKKYKASKTFLLAAVLCNEASEDIDTSQFLKDFLKSFAEQITNKISTGIKKPTFNLESLLDLL